MFDVLSRLKELQDAKGVSSYRLAKISDTPKSTLSGWRSAKRPPGIKKLEQICTDVLGGDPAARELPEACPGSTESSADSHGISRRCAGLLFPAR